MRDAVREHYASAALRISATPSSGTCCGGAAATGEHDAKDPPKDPITRDLYADDDVAGLPVDAVRASLGCGNPTALAELRPGETVLDLGSGGGIDVLLSARRVAPGGKAYGLDMTDEMLELARRNQAEAGVANAEFLKGTIEAIPLPDASVDVVISNCVINLSDDKERVLREVFRVLRPGGRFAVTDVVLRRPLPEGVRRSVELWSGCVAGALLESEYRENLAAAGFDRIDVEPVRIYTRDDVLETLGGSCCGGEAPAGDTGGASCCGSEPPAGATVAATDAVPTAGGAGIAGSAAASLGFDPAEIEDALMSAFVRATKP
jgi:SAM-dependent methyltransferase